MSWADDIRCLYCDGRLPLYRKITNGQFCSTQHRKAYWMEQERLAVERLHQTHDSLRSYRPHGPVEAILGDTEPEPAAELAIVEAPPAAPLYSTHMDEPQLDERPWWMIKVNTGELPVARFVHNAGGAHPCWLEDRLAGADFEPLEYLEPLRRPVAIYAPFDCGFSFAPYVHPEIAAAPAHSALDGDAEPLTVALFPIQNLSREVVPQTVEIEPAALEAIEIEPGPAPLSETLFALPLPALVESASSFLVEIAAFTGVMRVQLPLDSVRLNATPPSAELVAAGLTQLPVERLTAASGPSADSLRAVHFQAGPPQFDLATPPLRPRLRLAAGRRYPVESREPDLSIAVPLTVSLPARAAAVALPDRQAKVVRAAAAQNVTAVSVQEPNPTGLLPIPYAAVASETASAIRPAPTALTMPQPLRTEPMRPASRLEPIDAKPVADTIYAPPEPSFAARFENPLERRLSAKPEKHTGRVHPHVWVHAVDFWNRAPRDLKMLVFAIPVLVGLALHPSLPKVRVAAPAAATGLQRNFTHVVNQQWGTMRQNVLERAAVALDEDFRSGLDDWTSRGDATTDWSFDATGFVRPGPLAMYRPSMGLSDYQMQFLGMIDKKALSWVVRAVDFNNYYVIKLVVLKGGPLPTIGVTRYAVIDGKADSRADTIVPVDAREDMLYRVRLDVHGDDFALSVQGQMVDSWSESRLTHGGIGFFSAPGEESRVRWVQVTHQYDMLGRLCAYLAPYNITSSSGSWQQ